MEKPANGNEVIAVVVLSIAIGMTVFAMEVEGARRLPQYQPHNYFGGFGGTGGFVPTPFGPEFEPGPSGFCSFPGIGCVRVQPTFPGSSGGARGGSPPSHF